MSSSAAGSTGVDAGARVTHHSLNSGVITYDPKSDTAKVPLVAHHRDGSTSETCLLLEGGKLQLLGAHCDWAIARREENGVRAKRF